MLMKQIKFTVVIMSVALTSQVAQINGGNSLSTFEIYN